MQESQILTSLKLKDAYHEEDPQLEQNRSDIVTPAEEQYRIGRMDARPPHIENQMLFGMDPDPYEND